MISPRIARPHGASARAPLFVARLRAAMLPALAAVVLASPALAAEDHPRLGLYGHVNGQGWPIVTTGGGLDQALLDRIAARHVVVLDVSPFTEYRPDVLAALRARRPGIKLIGYVQAEYAFAYQNSDPATHIPTRFRNLVTGMGGLLYDLEGDEYDAANINLAKRDGQGRFVVAEAVADFFVNEILATGRWDGMYFDRFCTTIAWMQVPGSTVDHVRAGYSSFAAFDAAWQAATDTLANRLRRRAGNTPILIGNCGQGNKYAAFNGWMRENFPYQNGGSWQTNLLWPVGGYLTDEPKFRKPSAGWMTAWPTNSFLPYTTESIQKARMVLASAALGDGYGSINPHNMDPATGYMAWWYDEYAVNRVTGISSNLLGETGWLGSSKGPWWQMMWILPGVPDATTLNPGFESNVTTGWLFQTTVGATVVRDASTAAVGTASARIHVPAPPGAWYSTILTSIGSVPYTPETYTATFWAKSSVARPLYVVTVSEAGAVYFSKVIDITTSWQRYQVPFTGQFGTCRIEFRFGGTASDVWLDDVHFQRGAPPNVYRRDFDYGVVLVNPSALIYDVAMERPYRRLRGTLDPVVNDGTTSNVIRVRPNDAVFLLKAVEDMVAVDPAPRNTHVPGLSWSSAAPSPARAGEDHVRLVLTVREAAAATVDLFDARGRRVRALFDGALSAGANSFTWDGRDDGGRAVAPGLYFARARAGGEEAVRKLVCR